MKDPILDLNEPLRESEPYEFERRSYLDRRTAQDPEWEGDKNRRQNVERRQRDGSQQSATPSLWNIFIVAFSLLFLLTLLLIWILV